MERSIRIGKDFNVRWSINKVVDGERQPYELAGKELVLQYRTPYGLKEATEWKVVGNTIVWTFRGKEQKALGSYELILTENGGKDGMVTVDTCRAFKLVAHSCEETEGSGSDIVIEDVVLESEVAFAPIVIEGGGGSYDDTEIKKDIADLQAKDKATDAKLTELEEQLSNINAKPMVSVTYAELVELRDNGELVAGMQYRITDFVTTTAQENTRSAGHQFDVIVTADNEDTLNEVARACRSEFDIEKYKDSFCGNWGEKMLYVGTQEEYHLYESESHDLQMLVDFNQIKVHYYNQLELYPYYCFPSFVRDHNGSSWEDWKLGPDYGEVIQFKYDTPTYFATSKLEAWQIWYSLDNDAERFAWAIDFAFLREGQVFTWNGNDNDSSGSLMYEWEASDGAIVYTKTLTPQVGESTYDDVGDEDGIVENIINGKGVIYRMIDEWNNDCPYDFKNIQFKRNLNFDEGFAQFSEDGVETWVYTFAGQSYHIDNDELSDMLDGSLESPFGHMSDENTSTFHDNTIKPYIMLYNGNDIYTECGLRYLNDIVFLGYWEKIGSANEEDMPYYYAYCCHSNSFNYNCYGNSFNYDCYGNSFGNDCYGNSFGNYCNSNSFGNGCNSNSFGNDCYGNSFGNYCYSNSFGNGCSYNSFGNNCSDNSFGNNCSYNSFGNACGSAVLNENTTYKTASVNYNGEVKVFNLADLADLLNS